MGPGGLGGVHADRDGEVSPPDGAVGADPVAGCEECSRRLQALGIVDAAARELPAEAPAGYFSAFPGRVRRRLEGDTRERSWRVPAWTWAAAAAALLALVAPPPPPPPPLPPRPPPRDN